MGASALAIVALSPRVLAADATPPQDPPPKWLPNVSVSGGGGSSSSGNLKLTGFDPVWQDSTSLVFARVGLGAPTGHNGYFANFGVGYREQIDAFGDKWIAGMFGGFDLTSSPYNHNFTQASLGAEMMNADWDVRINGYLATQSNAVDVSRFKLFLHDTRIAIVQGQEAAYSGFDGEVGYRIFGGDNVDVRLFAGGFDFNRSNSSAMSGGQVFHLGHDTLSGPMGRAEVDFYNVNIFGSKSRLMVTGKITNDDERGTSGYVGALLQVPIGAGGADETTDELDRRMVDPVRRQDDVLVDFSYSKPEPVIIYNGTITSEPTNTLFYVDNHTGAGSYADPTTLHDATHRGPNNQFIVLTDRDGAVNASGVTVQSGETVAGPGTFTVKGANSGTKFTHDFAPGSGPVTVNTADGIILDPDTNLFGFTIDSTAPNAIYGHNVDDVVIGSVTIDGGGVGGNGIYFKQDSGTNGSVKIVDTTIQNLTGDAVKATVTGTGGTTSFNLDATNLTTSGIGGDGVDVLATSSGGGSTTTYVGIHDSSISAAGAGVYVGTLVDAASTGTQTVVIDPTTITGGVYGILVGAYTNGGTVTQNVSITDTTVSGASYAGVAIFDSANGGTATQTVNISNLTVHGGGTTYYPVYIEAVGLNGGTATQHITGSHITVDNGYYDNITLQAYAAYGGTVHQYAALDHVTTTGSVFGDGLFIRGESYDGGTAIQHVTASYLTADNNYFEGVGIVGSAQNVTPGDSAVTAQYVTLAYADASHNGFTGLFAVAQGFDDSITRQDVSAWYSSFDYNGGDGIDTLALAAFSGAAQQNVGLYYVDSSHNALDGARISAEGFALGSAQQNLYILGGTFDHNGADGIALDAGTFFAGQVSQNAGIYYAEATHNGGDGLFLDTSAYGYGVGFSAYYSHIGQNVIAAYDNFSNNARNGVEIYNNSGYGAQINQFVYLFDDHMDHNGPAAGPIPAGAGNGVYENSISEAYGAYGGAILTNLYSDVYVVASTADSNKADGIRVIGSQDGPGYLIQHIDVLGTDASYNGRRGFAAYDSATNFYSLNIQYITLSGSRFDNNGVTGAEFQAYQSFGPLSFGAAIQDVTISNSDFSFNYAYGLHAGAQATNFQGRAEQHFTIDGSYFNYNGLDGATFSAWAHDGVYYGTYNCGVVQGLYGGCAFVRQTIDITSSVFDGNGRNGIAVYDTASNFGAVYNSSGRPLAPTLLIAYSDVSGNGADGVKVENHADNNSYLYSYVLAVGSTFDDNAHNGIEVNSDAYSGSGILQKTIIYGIPGALPSSASYNVLGDGVSVHSTATGGSVLQLVGAYGTYFYGNGDSGVKVAGSSYEPTVAGTAGWVADPTVSVTSQYINAIGNVFVGNGVGAAPGAYEGGLMAGAFAYGPHAASQQYVTALGNVFVGNYVGLGVGGFAYFGGATNQYVSSKYNLFEGNAVGEIFIDKGAFLGFAKQTVYDYGNFMLYNGLGLGALADATSGGNVQQNLGIYLDVMSHNLYAGMALRTHADGYAFGYAIYYSHVSQNLVAFADTFSYNAGNGIQILNSDTYGGATNQFLYFYNVDAKHNGNAGIYENSYINSTRGNGFAFNTNLTTSLYLINSRFDYNTKNGIDLRAYNNGPVYLPAFFGGYSYQIQHTIIAGTSASYNGGDGLHVEGHAQGAYGLDAQYFTISGSSFDRNTGSGASFLSQDDYGPGGFGDTFQQITISDSDFSYNGGDGIDLTALATGRQGRAEQHTTITGSTMDYNGGDGVHIYASATDGVYIAGHPCDTVQGLPGGCAFVRQNTTIESSYIDHNNGNGVFVGTYANNYGAIYGASGRPHSPTLELYGVSVDYNGERGLDISNHVSANSYLYQYNALIDATFDHNSSDGIYSASYVGGGSVMLQRNLLYSYHTLSSASYNAGSGMKSTIEALGGSYARDVNIVEGVNLSNNGGWGLDSAIAYADASSTGLQINATYFNTMSHDGDGIGMYSIGPGAQQISYIDFNEVSYNPFVGVYGEANFGAFQYIQVYTGSNNVHDNGTNYLFNSFGGSTQILN